MRTRQERDRSSGSPPGAIAQASASATVDNVSLACMHVEPVSQWKGFSPGMTGMRAVYAISLAKRGFTGPRGLFEGPKGLEQIFAQSIQVDWEDRISVPQGPALRFAPDPSVIRTCLRAWTEGRQLSNFAPNSMHRSGLARAEAMKQLDDGIGNTLVSVGGNSAFARANSALRIDIIVG